MRHLLSLIILFTVPFLAVAQKSSIDFKQTSNYLGNIPQKEGQIKSIFTYTNSCKNALTISGIRTECDCISYELEHKEVAPGQSSNITIIFDPEQITGKFVKSIAVFSNTHPSTTTLTIRGYVIPQAHGPFDDFPVKMGDIRLSADTINMDIVGRGDIVNNEISIINASKENLGLTLLPSHDNLKATITTEGLAPLQIAKITLTREFKENEPLGPDNQNIRIIQNGKVVGKIHTFAEIHEDFSKYKSDNYQSAPAISINEYEFDMGQLECTTTALHKITVHNNGKNELKISKVICDDENVSVQIKKGIKGGKSRKITIAVSANQQPSLRCAEIKFYTNDPKNPVVTYNLFYEIVQ